MGNGQTDEQEDIIVLESRAESLKRENALLLKIVGGFGSLILLMGGGFLTFWIGTISDKFVSQQAQLTRQWDVLNQRAERISALENRLASNDQMTLRHDEKIQELTVDVLRLKNRFKMDN